MGSQSRTKKKKAARASKPLRTGDVKLLASRKLYPAAIKGLLELVKPGSGGTHGSLVADVFISLSRAIDDFTFTPENTSEFFGRIHDLQSRVSEGATDANRSMISHVVDQMRLVLGELSEAELTPTLITLLADNSIRRAELANRLPSDVVEEAVLVRRSLQLLEEQKYEDAVGAVAEIGFRSLMAPWRLLIRGMVAFHQNRIDDAEASFQRLPENRLPFSVAKILLATRGRKLGTGKAFDKRRLEKVFAGSVRERELLREEILEVNSDHNLVAIMTAVGRAIRNQWVDPAWSKRFVERLYGEFLFCDDMHFFFPYLDEVPGPAFDSKFELLQKLHRLTDSSLNVDEIKLVNSLIESICNQPSLTSAERPAMSAILGYSYTRKLFTQFDEHSDELEFKVTEPIVARLAGQFERVVKAFPRWDTPYQNLMRTFGRSCVTEQSRPHLNAIHEIRLRERGDEVDVLFGALDYYNDHDRDRATEIMAEIESKAPRDPRLRNLHYKNLTESVGRLVREGKYEDAYQVYETCLEKLPPQIPPSLIAVRQAVLLEMLGRDGEAEQKKRDAETAGNQFRYGGGTGRVQGPGKAQETLSGGSQTAAQTTRL